MVTDPSLFAVCIREIQKSIKDSVKRLIEGKIATLGVEELFTSTQTEIRRNGGTGGVTFTGIRNHTADRFKGFEGAAIAWIDEGEAISDYSLDLMLPTIRAPGSELWFSWNPRYADDPVDRLFRGPTPPPSSTIVNVSSWDNPWLSEEARLAREFAQASMAPDKFAWIYGGEYRSLGDDLVLAHKVVIESFIPGPDWDGPY
jgi:phage terminase large subunit